MLFELQGNILLYANSIQPDTSYTYYTYLFKFDSSGDSIFFFHNNDELKSSRLNSITLSSDTSSFILHLFGGYTPPNHSGCKYIEYDFSFQLLSNNWYDNPDFGQPYNTMNYSIDEYLSCGIYWPFELKPYPERYIRVMKMNEDFTVEDYIDLTFPDPDKPTYAAWYQCLDFVVPERIFVGGMEDKNASIWNPNPSWVYVACLNDDLELINEQYIGGDALYETFYVKATYDGGVILTGSKYDDSIQDYERDGFLMKFDSALFVGTKELKPDKNLTKTLVYPNPGQDNLIVQTSLPVLEFVLYNSLGIQIITLQSPDQIFTIITNYLPAGIYYWVVKYRNEQFNSGKWIKY